MIFAWKLSQTVAYGNGRRHAAGVEDPAPYRMLEWGCSISRGLTVESLIDELRKESTNEQGDGTGDRSFVCRRVNRRVGLLDTTDTGWDSLRGAMMVRRFRR